jgi:hypothetical protein
MKNYLSICFALSLTFLILSAITFAVPAEDVNKSSDISVEFPVIDGWKMQDKVEVYQPENLYEYIDGAADLYINYGFQRLYVAEYTGQQGGSVVVEIYFQKTPYHSFGIYSQERPTGGSFLNIGTQAYIEPPVLNFFKGNAYVKLNSYKLGNPLDVLSTFATRIAEKLDGTGLMPSILRCFPEPGKIVNSEKYVASNFLGMDFFHDAFTADYSVNGNSFQLFIIEGADDRDCMNMMKNYLELAKERTEGLKEGSFIINDPYHGKVPVVWKGRYLYGALNLEDETIRAEYFERINELLNK